MNSKLNQSNPSSNGENYEFPVDSCDHLISTSLRDLNKKYRELSRKHPEAGDYDKKETCPS